MTPTRLPKLCLTCLGYGQITVKRKWVTCQDCEGQGYLGHESHTSTRTGDIHEPETSSNRHP